MKKKFNTESKKLQHCVGYWNKLKFFKTLSHKEKIIISAFFEVSCQNRNMVLRISTLLIMKKLPSL